MSWARKNLTTSQHPLLAITATGMVSSLGRDAATSCAAARAGITREGGVSDFPQLDGESLMTMAPTVGYPLLGLTEGFVGLGRLLRLGSAGLHDLLRSSNLKGVDFSRTGLFVNVSSGYYLDWLERRSREEEGTADIDEDDEEYEPYETQIRMATYSQKLIPRLTALCGVTIAPCHQRVYFNDQMGVLKAIADASELMGAGKLDHCIVGGIDSLVEKDVLTALSGCDLLKTNDNPHGVLPGEAAAFIMLEREEAVKNRGGCVKGMIGAPVCKQHNYHRLSGDVPNGTQLAAALSEAITRWDRVSDQEADLYVICSLNGDPWKAQEWGNAVLMVSARHHIGSWATLTPAGSFGETGAALGATAVCQAIHIYERGLNKERVLIAMANDDGRVGVMPLQPISMFAH